MCFREPSCNEGQGNEERQSEKGGAGRHTQYSLHSSNSSWRPVEGNVFCFIRGNECHDTRCVMNVRTRWRYDLVGNQGPTRAYPLELWKHKRTDSITIISCGNDDSRLQTQVLRLVPVGSQLPHVTMIYNRLGFRYVVVCPTCMHK